MMIAAMILRIGGIMKRPMAIIPIRAATNEKFHIFLFRTVRAPRKDTVDPTTIKVGKK